MTYIQLFADHKIHYIIYIYIHKLQYNYHNCPRQHTICFILSVYCELLQNPLQLVWIAKTISMWQLKNIGSAPEKPTKPWRSSTFQCNWIKNCHSPWKRCLHYSKLWVSIEWSHFLAINFNWNNLHLDLSHPVPSCPSEPISVVPLPFCTGFQLRSSSHQWIVPVKGTAQEPPSVATSFPMGCFGALGDTTGNGNATEPLAG